MQRYISITIILAALGLAACDQPTVVNVPAQEAVPGPAGATGATGEQGNTGDTGNTGARGYEGSQGETGEQGETGGDTTVIVVPSENTSGN